MFITALNGKIRQMMHKKTLCYFVFTRISAIFASAKIIKMAETLMLSVLIIAIAIVLLSVKLIFRKNGKFESQHISDSRAMKNRGIHCVIEQDHEMRNKQKPVKE